MSNAKLPTPGSSNGTWGNDLNTFLSTSLYQAGTSIAPIDSPDNGKLQTDLGSIVKGGKVGVGTDSPSSKVEIKGDLITGAGTISSNTSNGDGYSNGVVTGVGTSFTTQVVPGDEIIVGSRRGRVETVTSDTSLTISTNPYPSLFYPINPLTSTAYSIYKSPLNIKNGGGDSIVKIDGDGRSIFKNEVHLKGDVRLGSWLYGAVDEGFKGVRFDRTLGQFSGGNSVSINAPAQANWWKTIVIDQPNSSILFQDGNSDFRGDGGNGGGGIRRLGPDQVKTVIFSATSNPAVKQKAGVSLNTNDTDHLVVNGNGNVVIGEGLNEFPQATFTVKSNDRPGTGTISSQGTTVTGVGTTFGNFGNPEVGDYIVIGNQKKQVVTITTGTSLTIDSAFSSNLAAGTSYVYHEALLKLKDVSSAVKLRVDTNGNMMATGKVSVNSNSFTTPTEALYVSGNIVATGTITPNSDERLKTEIQPIEGALDKISSLKGVTYKWKQPENHGDDNGTQIGLIAQDVEKAFPEAVRTSEDEMGTKSVNYNGLVGALVEAVKEQKQIIEELKARLEKAGL